MSVHDEIEARIGANCAANEVLFNQRDAMFEAGATIAGTDGIAEQMFDLCEENDWLETLLVLSEADAAAALLDLPMPGEDAKEGAWELDMDAFRALVAGRLDSIRRIDQSCLEE